MDIKDIPTTKKRGKTNPGGGTGIQALFPIETDEGWDEGYEKQTDTDAGTEQADREKLTQVDDQCVDEPVDGEGEEGAETTSERALQLLSAIETACRDLQKHEFSYEDKPEEARCPTILHRILWRWALEICGRHAWCLDRWAEAPNPNDPTQRDGETVFRLADMGVYRD